MSRPIVMNDFFILIFCQDSEYVKFYQSLPDRRVHALYLQLFTKLMTSHSPFPYPETRNPIPSGQCVNK